MTSDSNNRIACALVAFSLALVLVNSASAAGQSDGPFVRTGDRISEIVDTYRARGYKFTYSTSLLTNKVVVTEEPSAQDPVNIVSELLEPYDITVERIEGVLVIHKAPSTLRNDSRLLAKFVSATPPIPEVTVSASRYEILRSIVVPGAFIDQQQIQSMPILGDDPIRAAQVLPGVAANSASARSYIRGSDTRNTGIVLNGNALLEPYHVRNFQSLFSAIDSRAVDGIEVFAGNFPVQYGNRTGGMMIIDTMEPTSKGRTELGLSVFNASALSTGTVADDRLGWLVSGRRGNLDLVIDKKFGEPRYNDFLGQISAKLGDATTISFNALVATDKIRLVTESNPTEPEESSSNARSAQFWINWAQEWNPSLSSMTTVSINDYDNDRVEFANDPEEIVAEITDKRSLRVLRLNQHWQLEPSDGGHQFSFGLETQSLDASYDYTGTADYFGLFRMVEGVPDSISRRSLLDLAGQTYGVYMSDEFAIGDSTIAQLGLRWDTQNYGNLDKTSQLSPRFSIVHPVNARTSLRASIGRFYQEQRMHELQVEDGIEEFFSAQRTDSATIGIEHVYRNGLLLRAEAYWRLGGRTRPRFENVLKPITVLPEFKPDRMQISPTGYRSRGAELSLRRTNDAGLTWWASYVYSSADDEFGSGYVPRSWDQTHAGRFGLTMTGEKWDFGLVATAHSGWPKTSVNFDTTTDPLNPTIRFTEHNSQRYGVFATLDLRLRYTHPIRKGTLSYFFELSNATNRENECCVDFDVDFDEFNQPIFERESEYWLPLTPAIGILWQF